MRTSIWVDGVCFQTQKLSPGGWAVILHDETHENEELSGSSKNTTWYQMELMAILRGIKLARSVKPNTKSLVIHTDHEDSVRYLSEEYDTESEKEKGIFHYLQEIEWALGGIKADYVLIDNDDPLNRRVSTLAQKEAELLMQRIP